MRRLIPVMLTCVSIGNLASRSAAADLPIPQNPARQEKAFRDLFEWNRRTLGGEYEKVGKKDARWDKPAREAMEAAARFAGKSIDPAARWDDIYAPSKRAVEAGCDDPLLLFLYADSSRTPNRPEPAELQRRWAAAASAMERGSYPPLRRARALLGAGVAKARMENPTPADRKESARLFDAVLASLPRGAAKEESNVEAEDEWFNLAKDLVDGYRSLDGNLRAASNRVDAALAKIAGLKTIRLQVKAYWLIIESWEIRGKGLANSVTEENFRRFEAKNIEAYKTLQQAWAFNPKSYRTPTMMVALATALGLERSEMETWFRRAMELKDGNAIACASKMNYLDPKWHGSRQEMMEFGEACRATKNWRGGITIVSADVHMRWGMQLDDEERRKYMTSKEVWEHGKSVYEEYLSHYGADDAVRTAYAGFAYNCGNQDESYKQFKILGDRLVGSMTYPLAELNRYRAWFDRLDRYDAEKKARDAEKAKSKAAPAPPK